MILTVKQVVDLARVDQQDGEKAFWTDAELVDHINDGRDVLYLGIPRLYETTEIVALAAGVRQTLPNASRRLFGLLENITADSRRVVTPANRELMARIRPAWRAEDESDEILHFVYVETEPTIYEVYPPAIAGTQVRISYARPPARLPASAYTDETPLTQEAEMGRALVHYVLHRAYFKQSDTNAQAAQRSQAALATFQGFIQAEEIGKRDSSPNTLAIAGKPTEATNR